MTAFGSRVMNGFDSWTTRIKNSVKLIQIGEALLYDAAVLPMQNIVFFFAIVTVKASIRNMYRTSQKLKISTVLSYCKFCTSDICNASIALIFNTKIEQQISCNGPCELTRSILIELIIWEFFPSPQVTLRRRWWE